MLEQEPEHKPDEKQLTARQAYNIAADLGGLVNIRWRDNLYQAAFIVFATLVGAGIGAATMDDWRPGVLVGAFVGLVFGLLSSGAFLMVFRFLMHVTGHHD